MASNPPPWAYVDLRDEHTPSSASVQNGSAATAPRSAADGSVSPTSARSTSPTSSTKKAKMTSPNDFEFVKELGCGSWSTVMEAVQVVTKKRYAVKILSKAQLIKLKKVKYATVEKDALAKLSSGHPGFIRMHAAFQDETSLYFVLDLAPNGDLADLVKKYGSLALPCARWYIAQIVDAVLWMHGKGVLHRDLKPENVLLDAEYRIHLTDFGSAYIAPDNDLSPRASSFVGSAAYVSPELLDRSSKTTSESSDLWAIGCTIFFVVAGAPAFAAINDYQSFRKIEALDYTFPEGFYDVAKDIVQRLLVLDPSERLGVEPKSSPSELRNHSFFTSQTADPVAAPINWETLWTDPPVPPQTGIVEPSPRATADDHDDVWESMVHEFSLANLRSPLHQDGDPLSQHPTANGSGRFAPGPAVDVPPEVVPEEAIDTASSEAEPDYGPAPAPAANHEATEEAAADDPTLSAKDWSAVLAPGEALRRVAAVRTQLRKGVLRQNRACALLLTAPPRARVLCVLVAEKARAPKAADVKQSFVLPGPAGHANGTSAGKAEKNRVVGCRRGDDPYRLVLQTDDKEHTFEFADGKVLDRWIEELDPLVKAS